MLQQQQRRQVVCKSGGGRKKGPSVGGLVANYSCGDPFFFFVFFLATVFLSFFGADRKDGTKKTTEKKSLSART